MTGKRKRYSADFKAKVALEALEALRGEWTVAERGAKRGVHPAMITAWKKQSVECMAGVFSGKAEATDAVREGEVEKLHASRGRPGRGSRVSMDGRGRWMDTRVHRAALAQPQVRMRLPACLRDRIGAVG